MSSLVILDQEQFRFTLQRLSYQLIENHNDFSQSVIIGLQPRGIFLANRLKEILSEQIGKPVQCGSLDITFYRDDFRRRETPLLPSVTNLDFSIENKKVILVDDVLFSGRTARAGLDALLAYGRPSKVELLILIDRRFTRQLPIQPDYVGKWIDTLRTEHVTVNWKETDGKDQVILFSEKENE